MAEFVLRVFDVEHGACAIMASPTDERIAMIDCGHNDSTGWRPSTYIRYTLNRIFLDYLFVTNADQDHLSDLEGLWTHGVTLNVLHRNLSPTANILRVIKELGGELTDDIERFLKIHGEFNAPVVVPFNAGMGGVTCATFNNTYPEFTDTNNLSHVVFIKYAGFKMLFPGDIEWAGWRALLRNPAFVQELSGTNILVASHHGRENGFCEDIFNYFTPQAVVISDRSVVYGTQEMVPDYRAVVNPNGVAVLNQTRRRQVLTTRRDGDILIRVSNAGIFTISTSTG